jgi:hypothetical protein
MKKVFLLTPVFTSAICFSQSHQLKLTNPEKKNATFIKEGDKALMAVKIAKYQVQKKPSDIYLLSSLELTDSVYAFSKGKILSINDSTVIIKERNSFFSATRREIRINKINTLRKLSTANQIFRTTFTLTGGLALGCMLFYSYAAVGGGEGLISSMFDAAIVGGALTRFGRTKISFPHLNKWKMEVVVTP